MFPYSSTPICPRAQEVNEQDRKLPTCRRFGYQSSNYSEVLLVNGKKKVAQRDGFNQESTSRHRRAAAGGAREIYHEAPL